MKVYLLGAIHGGNKADIEWREGGIDVLYCCSPRTIDIMNPLGGKFYDPETKIGDMSEIPR